MKTCKYGCGKMKEGGKVTAVKKMKVGGTKSNPCFPKCSDGNGKCVPCPSTRIGDALIKTGLAAIGKYVAKTVSKNRKPKKTEAAQETVQEKRRGGSVKKYATGGSTIVGMSQYSNNPRTYSGRMLKKGGFPDLNKDDKITKADILKGRGVIKKLRGAKKR